jgi:hypothetical protein
MAQIQKRDKSLKEDGSITPISNISQKAQKNRSRSRVAKKSSESQENKPIILETSNMDTKTLLGRNASFNAQNQKQIQESVDASVFRDITGSILAAQNEIGLVEPSQSHNISVQDIGSQKRGRGRPKKVHNTSNCERPAVQRSEISTKN